MDTLILLDRFPLPPTVSAAYINQKRSGGRTKGHKLKLFEADVTKWWMINRPLISHARKALGDEILADKASMIKIDAWVCFHYGSLFTQDGERQKMDVSNRIKALHDSLANVLLIDDRYFMVGETAPVVIKDYEDECVTLMLSVQQMETRESLLKRLRGSPSAFS